MYIYNSLTNKKEKFTVKDNKINMYVCGPTVYNYIHIGNARPVIFFDFVKNYFKYKNFDVTYVSNITDIDDKIIDKAIKEQVSEEEIANKYAKEYFKNISALGCKTPDITPYATKYLGEMIKIIENLIKDNFAYQKNGDVYFSVSKLATYGTLSNQIKDNLLENVRVGENSEKNAQEDFTLWKKTEIGIKYPSPFGLGRPGWHTECVAMINKIFDNQEIDIHGGGIDIIFPHHENEVAQSEALNKHSLSRFFVHVGRININNEKMSKSLNNFILVKDLLNKYPAQALRIFILNTAYRSSVNYSEEVMEQSLIIYQKIEQACKNAYVKLKYLKIDEVSYDSEALLKIETYIEDDFNLPNVFTEISSLLKTINTSLRNDNNTDLIKSFYTLTLILDILGIEIIKPILTSEVLELYQKWEDLRKMKDFKEADKIREKLLELNIIG